MVKICYIDEAGCTGALPAADAPIQPVLVIAGIIIDYSKLHDLTRDIINLKQRYFPKLISTNSTHLDWIRTEIKGSEIRKAACSESRSDRRYSIGVLDKVQTLSDNADISLIGRVWVKGIATPMNGVSVYTSSIQSIYNDFQRYLTAEDDFGFVVLDSRLKHFNTQVAHSIFTQKFKGTGDSYDRVIELPAVSHSDNHAGLQAADLICSAFITPVAIDTYCRGFVNNMHVRPRCSELKTRYKDWLKSKQYRYNEASGRSRGGLTVSDGLGKKPGGDLFR